MVHQKEYLAASAVEEIEPAFVMGVPALAIWNILMRGIYVDAHANLFSMEKTMLFHEMGRKDLAYHGMVGPKTELKNGAVHIPALSARAAHATCQQDITLRENPAAMLKSSNTGTLLMCADTMRSAKDEALKTKFRADVDGNSPLPSDYTQVVVIATSDQQTMANPAMQE